MCCFSRPVKMVADTNIFARASTGDRQFLVYSMKFAALEELAMILPIPTPKDAKEDALKFINLEKYPKFFDEMNTGFPVPPLALSRGEPGQKVDSPPKKKLEVVEVGGFVASFVPTVGDFKRLDEQFRLPDGTWDKLPQYKDFGFAVFKLKKGEMKVHPMAFEFPRADRRRLFFPTVHIHDGKIHDRAKFDHSLFCQGAGPLMESWVESVQPAELFMPGLKDAQGLVDGREHVYRMRMGGVHKNADILV